MGLINVYDQSALFFPFQPDAPLTEVLEWKTDVINSHDGTEYRYRVRNAPRQSFSFSVPIPPRLTQLANNVAYAGPGTPIWAVPVWTEAQRLPNVEGTDEALPAETTSRDFREGGWAMLWESPEKWRAVKIAGQTANELTLDAPVGIAFTAPWLFPVNIGRLGADVNRNTDGFQTRADFRLITSNNYVINPPAPDQFLGHDIYFDETFMSGTAIDEKIETQVDIIDFDTGPVAQFAPWKHNRRSRPYRRIMEGAAEVWAFREWVHRRAGKFRPFWLPTFEHDLYLDMAPGPVGTSLLFRVDEYTTLTPERTHVAIQTRDGSWHPRTITGVTGAGAFRTATLDRELVNVDSDDIVRVSFLGLHRLDTDRVQLSWIGGGVCVSEGTVLELSP